MKKTRIIAVILAGIMMFTGVPYIAEPLTVISEAASSKLSAPSGIKATAGETSIKLSWNKVSGADRYRVYKYNSKTEEYEKYKDVTQLSCTVSNLKETTTYKFKIATLKKSGSKYIVQTKSNPLSVKTKQGKAGLISISNPTKTDSSLLPAPANIQAQTTGTKIILTWAEVPYSGKENLSYMVYRYNDKNGTFERSLSRGYYGGGHAEFNNLKPNTTYKFIISSFLSRHYNIIEQNQTGVITIKTKAIDSAVSTNPDKYGEISSLKFGMSLSDAKKLFSLNKKDYKDDYDNTCYESSVTYNGYASELNLYFNYKDQLYNYAVICNNHNKFEECFSNLKKKYGYDFKKETKENNIDGKMFIDGLPRNYHWTFYTWKSNGKTIILKDCNGLNNKNSFTVFYMNEKYATNTYVF